MRNTFNDDHGDYLMHFKFISKHKSAAGNWVYEYADKAKAAVGTIKRKANTKIAQTTKRVKSAYATGSNYVSGLAREAKRVSNVAGVMARGKVRTATAYAKRAANEAGEAYDTVRRKANTKYAQAKKRVKNAAGEAYDKAYDAYDTVSGHKAQRHEAKVAQNKQRAQARADRFERNDYRNSESAAKQQRANQNKANARARQDRFERENYRRDSDMYKQKNANRTMNNIVSGAGSVVRNGVQNAYTGAKRGFRNVVDRVVSAKANGGVYRKTNAYNSAMNRYNNQKMFNDTMRRSNMSWDTNDILYGKKKKK